MTKNNFKSSSNVIQFEEDIQIYSVEYTPTNISVICL